MNLAAEWPPQLRRPSRYIILPSTPFQCSNFQSGRLVTPHFALDDILKAYDATALAGCLLGLNNQGTVVENVAEENRKRREGSTGARLNLRQRPHWSRRSVQESGA